MRERKVVITGASGGIGAAAAIRLSAEGHRLLLVARRAPELEQVAAQCGGRAFFLVADATRRDAVRSVVLQAIERLGGIDVWINNVGQGITRMPSELSEEDLDEMFRVNVKSALFGMQEVLPHFQARGEGQIINISSMLGRVPLAPFRSAYSASKHYLNALTANFRAEVQQTHPGIQFTLVSPGVVRTGFGAHARHGGPDSRELPDSQSAEEIAEVIARVIETRAPDVYTRPGARDRVLAHFSSLGTDP